jgi:hypothetical protein
MHKQGELTRNFTVRLSEQLYKRIQQHGQINWSLVVRSAIEGTLKGQLQLVVGPDGPVLVQSAPGTGTKEKRKKT